MKGRDLVSVAELTAGERTAFVNAVLALKAAPSLIADAAAAVVAGGGVANRYDDYVWMHSTVGGGAHFGPAFGPWHREFLRQFEFDLRQVSGDPDIVIPYWDWTTGRVAGDPNWPFTDDLLGPLGDATGLVTSGPFSNPATFRMNIRRTVAREDNLAQVPDTNVALRRRPTGPAPFALPTAATARTAMAQATPYDVAPFNEFPDLINLIQGGATQAQINAQIVAWTNASFRKFLEWALHNGPHTWVGGDDDWAAGPAPAFIAGPMSIPEVSVNDPVFWLHHCNVDRLWTTWQQRNPPGAFAPAAGADAGHNLNNEMVHFEAANAANFNAPLRSTPADLVDSRGALDIWYISDLPLITPVDLSVDFGDVPANLKGDWPAKFDVRTCRRVKFRITAISGANFSIPPGGDLYVEHDHDHDPVRANVFVEFQALGPVDVVQNGTATIGAFIDDTEGYYTGVVGSEFQVGTFPITLAATPVAAPRAAVTFVLDRSGSMSESAGPLGTKYDLLQSSLRVVASLMRSDDAIGLVSYDDLVATLTPAMLQMGTVMPAGPGRAAVETAIVAGDLAPRGLTAIGQGMIAGATLLQTVQADPNYPTKAMVVMTDGNENVDPSVVDPLVQAAISWFNDRVYAIGLGTETNVSAATLGAIAVYQLITGNITSFQQQFLLTKYFLQILAQVTDSAIVVDPQGELRRGDEHRIPFDIGEGDVSIDVVALSPLAPLLDFTLEAPDGTLIGPGAGPNVTFQLDAGDEFYRVLLPAIPGNAAGTHAGRWTAILGIRDPRKVIAPGGLTRVEGSTNVLANVDRQALQAVATRGALPYTLFVQSYSNLKMRVEVRQDSYLPGATLTLVAVLTEYRIPLRGPARVIVEVTEPDGREVQVQLDEVEPGRFSGAHVTGGAGIYRCRFRAHGTTRGGKLFQREDTRTAAINARLAPGGDLSSTVPGGGGGDHDRERWCALIACLLREPSIIRLLQKHDVDPAEIAACVKRYCTMARVSPSVAPTRSAATSAEDVVMSEETERLKNELTRLRAELKKEAAFDSVRWDDLLTPAPKAVATPPKPERAADEHVHHESHHTRALPALVTDEDGNTRVLLPAGHGASVEQRGGRGQGGGPEDGGHDHGPTGGGADSGGGHTHGHGEADRRPKKR